MPLPFITFSFQGWKGGGGGGVLGGVLRISCDGSKDFFGFEIFDSGTKSYAISLPIFAKTLTNLLRDLFAKKFKLSSQCWQIFHFELLLNFDNSF